MRAARDLEHHQPGKAEYTQKPENQFPNHLAHLLSTTFRVREKVYLNFKFCQKSILKNSSF